MLSAGWLEFQKRNFAVIIPGGYNGAHAEPAPDRSVQGSHRDRHRQPCGRAAAHLAAGGEQAADPPRGGHWPAALRRAEELSVGKECDSTCRSRGWPDP